MNSIKENKPLIEVFAARPSRFKLAKEGLIKAGINEECKVLEIGSSFGDVCLRFVNEFKCNFVGVDIEQKSIDIANEKLTNCEQRQRVSFYQGSAYDLPLKNDSFDLMLSEAAFSLLENKDKAVKEYCRVLKPSGRIVVNDFKVRGKVDEKMQNKITIPCFKSVKSVAEYTEIFEKNGFKLISNEDFSKEVFRIALHLKKTCSCADTDVNTILAKSKEETQSDSADFKKFFNSAKIGYVQLIFEKK